MKNKRNWIVGIALILILTNIATFYGSSFFSTYLPNGKVLVSSDDYEKLKELKSAMKGHKDLAAMVNSYEGVIKFKKLFEIRNQLYDYYDGPINDDDLVEGAIKGMTASLKDPYTVFMNKKEYESFSTETSGEYVGIGFVVGVDKDNNMVVTQIFDKSPAKKAGIQVGDIIKAVNGKEYTGSQLDDAIKAIKGEENTTVNVTLYRASKGTFTVKATRQKVTNPTVSGEMLSGNVGYMQLTMFDENSDEAFDAKLNELLSKGMKGLILDLRDNGGGLLDTSVNIASNFVRKGSIIVSIVNKYNQKQVSVSKGGSAQGLPLVVLVNENTASASEIFSGAIRDYKAGTLVGKTTFGKGIAQSTIPDKEDGTALKVTTEKYYLPSGENIHHKGIKPDVEIELPDSVRQNYDRSRDPQFQKALEVINSKIK